MLKDKAQIYYTTAGIAVGFIYVTSKYEETIFDYVKTLMPYEEMDFDPAMHNLKIDIDFNYDDIVSIQYLTYYDFSY